jgi:hypothetical protein
VLCSKVPPLIRGRQRVQQTRSSHVYSARTVFEQSRKDCFDALAGAAYIVDETQNGTRQLGSGHSIRTPSAKLHQMVKQRNLLPEV